MNEATPLTSIAVPMLWPESRKATSRWEFRCCWPIYRGMAVRSLSISDATVFLRESGYRRKVFTEPSPGMVARYGRRTCRSGAGCVMPWAVEPVRDLASARACWLALDTAHQLHQRRPATLVQAPRVLSIDDWAWRKGYRYGTILCDLETGKVVDLLPDRDANTVAA